MGTLKKIKRILANRGGVGASLSRGETIERLNPLVRRHMEMNYAYDAATRRLSSGNGNDDLKSELRRQQKIARADVGKLRETILSMGGVADNGVDLEPDDFDSDRNDDALIDDLCDREQKLMSAVDDELGIDLPEHHLRTIAILEKVREHSKQRLDFIKSKARGSRHDGTDGALPSEKQASESAAVVSGKEPEALEEAAPQERSHGDPRETDAPEVSEQEAPSSDVREEESLDEPEVATDADAKDSAARAEGTEGEVSDAPEDEQQAPDEQTDELRENPPGGADEAQNETDMEEKKKAEGEN